MGLRERLDDAAHEYVKTVPMPSVNSLAVKCARIALGTLPCGCDQVNEPPYQVTCDRCQALSQLSGGGDSHE